MDFCGLYSSYTTVKELNSAAESERELEKHGIKAKFWKIP
jgi:hypothetical protein